MQPKWFLNPTTPTFICTPRKRYKEPHRRLIFKRVYSRNSSNNVKSLGILGVSLGRSILNLGFSQNWAGDDTVLNAPVINYRRPLVSLSYINKPRCSYLSSNAQAQARSVQRRSLSQTRSISTTSHLNNTNNKTKSASDKLFEDAAREEAIPSRKSQPPPILTHENWTGDESMQDAVLRMLVDKYKPLRSGSIQSADQKLRHAPPNVSQQHARPPLEPRTGSWATEPLLPSSPEHRPWHTEFKAPSHAGSSIKLAQVPMPMPMPVSAVRSSVAGTSSSPDDERLRRKEREEKKRTMHAGRLAQARESTLDYRLGIRNAAVRRANPVGMKGWTSLIEDKIEKARMAGLFKDVKGRGLPMKQTIEEKNPFIAREEYLMNRIVQRNGAAPAWVEVQSELDTAISSFRAILHQSWVRRAVRLITITTPPTLLSTLTPADIRAMRDPEWVQREASYHETAIAQLNELVRKYNGLAPYAVRRAYCTREGEVERMYKECVGDVVSALEERAKEAGGLSLGRTLGHGGEGRRGGGGGGGGGGSDAHVRESGAVSWGVRDLIKKWLDKMRWW